MYVVVLLLHYYRVVPLDAQPSKPQVWLHLANTLFFWSSGAAVVSFYHSSRPLPELVPLLASPASAAAGAEAGLVALHAR